MKRFFHTNSLLIIIIFVAAILRFYQLGSNPPSLTWDEVAWGYNAYALGIDGKDEFGKLLPYTYLESFGDFKPPMYAYLSILPVKLFGLTEFATRFTSAFFGTLTVLLTYFLTKAIFRSPKSPKKSLPLIAAALLAVSPWHIMLSRAAFEANVATFFIVCGVWLFLEALRKRPMLLVLSAISFALSFYTFNTARVVVPLLGIVLIFAHLKQLWEMKKATILAGSIGVMLLVPLVPFFLSPQAQLRFKEVNIFTNPEIVKTSNQSIANDDNAWWSKIIHNRRILYASSYVSHYLDHFSPTFLFIKGDGNPKFSTQDVGQLYIWSLPFFIIGSFLLFRKREGKWWLVPIWLLIGIIPAATARETPHALRIETTLPTFQILIAYGVFYTLVWVKQHARMRVFQLVCGIMALGYFFNITYFVHGYYAHYAWVYSREWQYGYKESIAFVKAHEKDYDRIFVTETLGRPYIYYLFYLQIPPEQFRQQAKIEREVFGFVNIYGFGKYVFIKDREQKVSKGEKILYITDRYSIPENAHVLQTFYELNGEPVIVAWERAREL